MAVVARQFAVVAVVFGIVLALCTGRAAVAVADTPAAGCAPVSVVMMAGTTETSAAADPSRPVGMLKKVTDKLVARFGSAVSVVFPPYSASAFDKGLTYVQSKQTGIASLNRTLTEAASRCPATKFITGGYSQGADIAGDVASNIGNGRGPISADRVLGVALLADPGQGAAGESVVGPKITGSGMGGNRPGGMGALSGRVATICNPGDLYCNLDRNAHPMVANISSMLAMTPAQEASKAVTSTGTAATAATSATAPGGVGAVPVTQGTGSTGLPSTVDSAATPASALTSQVTQDWSSADLSGLGNNVRQLGTMLSPGKAGEADPSKIAATANSVVNTLSPLTNLIGSGTADKTTTNQLASAAPGSPERTAANVLGTASSTNLSGALQSAQTIAQTATSLAQGSSGTTSSPDPDRGMYGGSGTASGSPIAALSGPASALSQQTAPLTATPSDQLATASNVLSLLGPQKIISQIVNVVTGITSVDWMGLINTLNIALQKVFALDVAGVHAAAQQLATLVAPLVKMAANIDFHWIAQILRAIPDPSGATQIAAMVCDFVGNLDVIRLANDIGAIANIAFDVVEKRNLLRLADLVPTGLDLASVAIGVLNGGTKTAVDSYAPNQAATSTLSTQTQNVDIKGLINSFTGLAGSQGAADAAQLVDLGITAAGFWGTGTPQHTGYANYKVDNSGRSAIDWFADWIGLKIQQVVGANA